MVNTNMSNINKQIFVIETSRVRPCGFQVLRGESVDVVCNFLNYGQAVSLTGLAGKAYWKKDDGTDPSSLDSWYVSDNVTILGNTATWSWTADDDAGENAYQWFIEISGSGNVSYRAFGCFKVLGSPGEGHVAPLPDVPDFDFDKYNILNAPWEVLGLLKGDGHGGITAAVAGTDYVVPSTLAQYLLKQDVVAPTSLADYGKAADARSTYWQINEAKQAAQNANDAINYHVNKTDNPHMVTAAQVGAVPLNGNSTINGNLTLDTLLASSVSSSGNIEIMDDEEEEWIDIVPSSISRTLQSGASSMEYVYSFPELSGTFAMVSQIPTTADDVNALPATYDDSEDVYTVVESVEFTGSVKVADTLTVGDLSVGSEIGTINAGHDINAGDEVFSGGNVVALGKVIADEAFTLLTAQETYTDFTSEDWTFTVDNNGTTSTVTKKLLAYTVPSNP